MGSKGVDPLREGANSRRHKPQAQGRACAGLSPYSESWVLQSHYPVTKTLGFQGPNGESRAEDINPGVLDMGTTWRPGWKVPLRIDHPTEKQLDLCVSCSQNTW